MVNVDSIGLLTKIIENMSVTSIIDDGKVTIVQGVNGILLCKESWMNKQNSTGDWEVAAPIFTSDHEEMEMKNNNGNR